MGCILPSQRVEVVYRFTVPLPVRVTVAGVEWEFFIWHDDYPPYYALKVRRTDGRSELAHLIVCDSMEQAEFRSRGPIRFDYPNTMVPMFKQLMREGKAERVWGPHTQLYYLWKSLNDQAHRAGPLA